MLLHRPFFVNSAPKYYLCSKFPAMPSIELQLTAPITLQTLEQIFRKWMEGIELDADQYEEMITLAENHGRVFD